jgi:hypothetical protein
MQEKCVVLYNKASSNAGVRFCENGGICKFALDKSDILLYGLNKDS